MTLAQIRSRTKIKTEDFDENESSDELIDAIINEGLREMARKTLLLDGSNSSLTYSSPGFSLPSDFIKTRDLLWKTSNNVYSKIEATSIGHVYAKREASSDNLVSRYYAIEQSKIILDNTSQSASNLVLYYYKYDTALSADGNSPSFGSEHHKYLIDYTTWQLTGKDIDRQLWERGLKEMLKTRPKSSGKRMRYKVL